MTGITTLIIEDEPLAASQLCEFLAARGYLPVVAAGVAAARARLSEQDFAVVLTDIRLPDGSGLDLITGIRAARPGTIIMAITAHGTIEDAVSALKRGADQYLLKPLDLDELLLLLERERERQTLRLENRELRAYVTSLSSFPNVIGSSPALVPVIERVRKLCTSHASVLITGESGTGKGLIARTLHYAGIRQQQRFVAVDCAAIPDPLLESELFGHARGSFTGAVHNHQGRFEYADGGTVFLDEIGELSPAMQAKLLRVLQERAFTRLGTNRDITVDVRIIAATNRDLRALVDAGTFREDLYWRLNVVQLHLSPLRERREDIEPLLRFFLDRCARRAGITPPDVAPEVYDLLQRYPWPGNIRELENVIERALTLLDGTVITPDTLPTRVREFDGGGPAGNGLLGERIAQTERDVIAQVLRESGGHRQTAARRLGISLRSLQYKIKQHSLA